MKKNVSFATLLCPRLPTGDECPLEREGVSYFRTVGGLLEETFEMSFAATISCKQDCL